MLERFQFLVVYVGSAAMAAFLAACLSSPRIATFACPTSDANGAEQCELAATLAVGIPEAGMMNPEGLAPDSRHRESVGVAVSR